MTERLSVIRRTPISVPVRCAAIVLAIVDDEVTPGLSELILGYSEWMFDRHDTAAGTSSVERTNGYTRSAIADALARGFFIRSGPVSPKVLGRVPACFNHVCGSLDQRGARLTHRDETLS